MKESDLKHLKSDIRERMRSAAERLSLPLKAGLRGTNGHVPGSGVGSSIDFQDHRPYVPGDDPRHIDWQAYARSGHYTMKLYREEVRPLVDLVLDISASMFLDETKARRTLELAGFCIESSLRAAAALRIFSLAGGQVVPVGVDLEDLAAPAREEGAPDLARIPWRAGSLRVFLSDLLYPASPASLLPALLALRGRAVLLVPFSPAETDPDWLGNTELLDCESGGRRDLRFHREDLAHYTDVYQNHFDLWRDEARRFAVPLARVSATGEFLEALVREGIASGAVELT